MESTENGSVLFLDDDKSILKMFKRIFINEPLETFYSDSVSDAISILENNEIEIVVSDLTIPGQGGLKFLNIVREKFPHIIRIVITGHAEMPLTLKQQKDDPVFRYIVKPWPNDHELVNTVKQALELFKYKKFWFENKYSQNKKSNEGEADNDVHGEKNDPEKLKIVLHFLNNDVNNFVHSCDAMINKDVKKYVEISRYVNFKKDLEHILHFINSLND